MVVRMVVRIVVRMVVRMVVTDAVENDGRRTMELKYTSRSLRRRRNTDQWECSLSHTDPVTGEVVRTYHTLVAKMQR